LDIDARAAENPAALHCSRPMQAPPPPRAFALHALATLTCALVTGCDPDASRLPLVINEVHATPPEWVEILNLSDQAQPLRDVQLMGSDADGRPTEERAQLPDIAILPGEHFVVALGKLNADRELHVARECNIDGVTECAFAAFRVRAEEGETVHLFENSRRIDSFDYAPRGAGLDETLCRLPNGTGTEQRCTLTPAAQNIGPL
jgi:hypothetical protein